MKRYKIFWIISALLLLVILVGGMLWFAFHLNSKSKASSIPIVLFMQANLPDYPKHKNGSIVLSTFDMQSGQKTAVMNLDTCYNLPSTLSPDKTKIAYITMSNGECEKQYYTNLGNAELWVYNFQTRTKQLVASGLWNLVMPQWSFDGKYLGYERLTDSKLSREQNVYLYNLDSKEERLITTLTGVFSGLVAISKDRNYIYFKTSLDLLKINIQSGTQTKLFSVDNGYDASFYLSPDRTRIAVFSMEGWYGGKKTSTNWKIGVVDLANDSYKELYNGSDQLTLPLSDSLGNNPVIGNDFRVIYGITGQNAGLWSISLTNGSRAQIKAVSQDIQGISTIDISLDGKYLLYGTWKIENMSAKESWSHWYYYVMKLSDNSVQEISNFDYHTERAIFLMN